MRVLWLDDNKEFVDTACGYLRTHGHDVDPFSNWEAAMKACRTHAYDVVIADWDLEEEGTGTDFFRELEREGLQLSAEWRLASYHYQAHTLDQRSDETVPESSLPTKVLPVPIDARMSSQEQFDELLLEKLVGESDPTGMTFGAYATLGTEAKIDLIEEVYERYSEKVDGLLDRHTWFLACGGSQPTLPESAQNTSVLHLRRRTYASIAQASSVGIFRPRTC